MQFLDRYLFLFVHLKGLVTHGFSRAAYGQWAEDLLIGGLAPEKSGLFVDVGAFHPMHYSNTYLLYRRGWRGVAVDPNPSSELLWKIHRPRDTFVRAGVSKTLGEKPYFVFNHQSCNSFSESHRDRMLARPFMRLIRTDTVQLEPLERILMRTAPEQTIDVLNVDVEGMNLEVLETLDWQRRKPRVVCVEDDDLMVGAERVESPIHTFMSSHGYSLRERAGQSSLYTYGG